MERTVQTYVAVMHGDRYRRDSELCFGGDWACAHGNVGALADIAMRLAFRASEPLQTDLLALAHLCRRDPAEASARWFALRPSLLENLAPL